IAGELQERAKIFLTERDQRFETKRLELGVGDEIAALEGITPAMLVALGEKGVKTLDDLGDLAGDELVEIVQGSPYSANVKLDQEQADAIIMAARAHWFAEEETAKE